GVLACAAGALLARRALQSLGGAADRVFLGFAGFGLLLVLFKNFTADVCHPDNLHALQTRLVLLVLATSSGELASALGAVAVAGLGGLIKQPASFSAAGALVALWATRAELR